jgi:tetratricopeptide (TPR) repeat protein
MHVALGVQVALNSEASDGNCDIRGALAYEHLTQIMLVADPTGWLRSVYNSAQASVVECPDSESVWYALLRSAEILGAEKVRISRTEVMEYRKAVESAWNQIPHSARIATIRARLLGTVESAESAVSLDPRYAPAHIALARAQLTTGNTSGAQETMRYLAHDRSPGVHVLLARIEFAQGNYKGAIEQVKRERSMTPNPVEPMILPDEVAVRDSEEVAGLSYLQLGNYHRAAIFLVSATVRGSESGVRSLNNADPRLLNALRQLANDPSAPATSRDVASHFLSPEIRR